MFYLHLRVFAIVWLIIIIFGIGFLNGQTVGDQKTAEISDEILIFRTSPGIELEAEGFFRFQVSTFSPILVVKVNGFAQMVTHEKDWAQYEIPFYLEKGRNLFTVFVQTETSQKEKEFIVKYEPQKRKVKTPPPLKGVVMIGQTNSDNILNVEDGNSKTSSSKYDILVSVGYSFNLNRESDVSLSAVLKFDHYPNRSLIAEEVLFRQFSTDYRHRNLLGLNINSGIGQNVISLKNVNSSDPYKAGEFSIDVQSLFLFFSASKKWGDFSGSFKVQTDSQDKIKNDSEDGTLTLSSLGSKMRWGKFRINAGLDSKSTTFKDPLKDYESTTIETGGTFSWIPWVFGLNYNNFDQKYKKPDVVTNVILQIKKDEISTDAKYAFSNSNIFGLALKRIKQASNDSSRSYSESQVSFQYIWMF